MATSTPLKILLAKVIRRRRLDMGFSQEAFADHLEMHRAFYGRIENGQNLTLQTLERVSNGLGLKVSQLLQEAENLTERPSQKRRDA